MQGQLLPCPAAYKAHAYIKDKAVPRQNSIRMELNPRVTLLHPQAILGETGMLRFGKLLIRKVPRERGVLTRDKVDAGETHQCPCAYVQTATGGTGRRLPRTGFAHSDSVTRESRDITLTSQLVSGLICEHFMLIANGDPHGRCFLTVLEVDRCPCNVTQRVDIFIALSPSLVCKSGSVGSDGSVASTTASSVSQIHADIAAIWALTASF